MNFRGSLLAALLVGCASAQQPGSSVSPASDTAADQVRQMERDWNDAIDRRDAAAMERFLAPTYFLGVGVQGQPLHVVPREAWLRNLAEYDIQSYSIDDMKVNVYGNVAIVTMLFTQKAVVGPNRQDRSAQFFITDVWVRHPDGWRVAERHSSRPEQPR